MSFQKKYLYFHLAILLFFQKLQCRLILFEPRYIDMVNDSMKTNKMIGMIQPKSNNDQKNKPDLHEVGCLGKITSFAETNDGRFLIEVKGLNRFHSIKELETEKKYRILEVILLNFLTI